MPTTHAYGWLKDSLDQRDYRFAPAAKAAPLPPSVNLIPLLPPVYDQQQEGSCTANMTCAALDYAHSKAHGGFLTPSRQFQYYNARLLEGTTKSDAGASIRDAIKAAATYGICPESEWPYVESNLYHKPTAKCYTDAKKDIVQQYQAVPQTLDDLRAALAQGLPVCIGIGVYESFESEAVAKSGIVPLPGKHEKLLGGHAVLLVGYSDGTQSFTFRNSWGSGWGAGGYATLPYAYLLNPKLASDFWVVQASN